MEVRKEPIGRRTPSWILKYRVSVFSKEKTVMFENHTLLFEKREDI
jgi:hypothetical protein